MKAPRRNPVRVALAGLALAVMVIVLAPRGSGPDGTELAAEPTAQQPAGPPDARPELRQVERPAPGTAPETSALALAQTRDRYLEFSVYPPWSRPATPTYAELYDFNQTGPSTQQAIGNIGRTEIHARVALDRVFVEPGRTAVLTAECWTMKDGARGNLDFEAVVEVQVASDEPASPDDHVAPLDVGFRTSPGHLIMESDGDRPGRRVGRVDVGDFPALAEAPRAARLLVWFQSEGAETKPLELPFMYSTRAPVAVLGVAGDEIVNGSLEVTLEVDIAGLTPVRLRGALAQAGHQDHPIATYDRWYRPTQAGRQQVTLQFFGKILRDAELDGPYEVFRVHGSAYLASAPLPEVFWQDDRSFRTRAYRAEQFSGNEWRDPEKDDKARAYAEVIDSLRRAEGGR